MSAKLLIVDDTPETVILLSTWLQSEGYQTINAVNGPDALTLAAQEHPDLILLDVTMPLMDGIETCRLLRANPITHEIPVIMVTAKSPAEARVEATLAGAVDYVTKPLDLPNLSEHVSAVLRVESAHHTDTTSLFDEMVHSSLVMLPCDLAWLFTVETQSSTLQSLAIAAGPAKDAARRFIEVLGGDPNDPTTLHFELVEHDNPLADMLATREMVLNRPLDSFFMEPGADRLHAALHTLSLNHVSLLPLSVGSRIVGILVIGTIEKHDFESTRGLQIIGALAKQAGIAIDYAQLAQNLIEQEQIMQVEQAFLTMVMDTMGDGLIVIGETGAVDYVNTRLLRMTGYEREDLFDQSVEMLFHPDDRVELRRGLLKDRGSTMKFDQRLLTKRGHVIPVLLSRSSFANIEPGALEQVLVLSDLTEQKSREEALERQSDQLQALNRAAQAITSTLSSEEVLTQILDAAVAVVNSQGASITLRSKENPDELVFTSAVGPGAETMVGMRMPLGHGIVGWVALEATSQLVPDTSQDERFYSNIDQSTGLSTKSLIAVPLIYSQEVIGVLEVVNKLEGPFDSMDVELLENMAGTAAVAIQNAQLFDQTRRRLNELGTLFDASAAVSSTLDFGSVLELIARRLVNALNVEQGVIIAWSNETSILYPLAEVVDAYWSPGEGPISNLGRFPQHHKALQSGAPIFARVNDQISTPAKQESLKSAGQQAMLGFPLWINKQVVGMATLYSSLVGHTFTNADATQVDLAMLEWQQTLKKSGVENWRDEKLLTQLCNALLIVPGVTWIAIEEWEPGSSQTRRLRESGFALWTETSDYQLNLEDFPTMKRVLSTANPKVVGLKDLDHDPREKQLLERAGGEVCLMAPLLIHGAPRGLVKLIDSQEERHFETEEISLCQGIANVVGNAMENAQLYQSLERRAEALEDAYIEVQQADQLKSDLLQNLSHELQTPLQHILGYAGLLSDESFGPLNAEQREHLEFVVKRAQHVSDVVKDIVSVQSLHNEPVKMHPTNLGEVIEQVARTFAESAAQRMATVDLQISPQLPPVMADPKRLAEALHCLIDNAIKFSPDGGRILVKVNHDDTGVTVQVRDQGIGIPQDAQERIFERFFQVDGSATRQFGGTGLGLFIVKEIVAQHQGRIWVKSEPGQGSTFIFTLDKSEQGLTGQSVRATSTSDNLPPVNPFK